MFDFGVGKNIADGALKRIGELISNLDGSKINDGLNSFAEKIPLVGIFVKGFNAMTPEEQAEFAKNIMLAGAALAAKSGGKVNF